MASYTIIFKKIHAKIIYKKGILQYSGENTYKKSGGIYRKTVKRQNIPIIWNSVNNNSNTQADNVVLRNQVLTNLLVIKNDW